MKAKNTTTNTKTVETTQNIPTNNSNTLKDKDKKSSVSPKDSNKDTKKVEDNRSPLEKKSFRLLKNNGMLDGYKFALANICKDGLPQGDVFEYAAYLFASYEKKWKQLKSKEVKEKIIKFKEENEKDKDVKQKVDDKKDIKDTNKDVKKDIVAKPVVVSKKK